MVNLVGNTATMPRVDVEIFLIQSMRGCKMAPCRANPGYLWPIVGPYSRAHVRSVGMENTDVSVAPPVGDCTDLWSRRDYLVLEGDPASNYSRHDVEFHEGSAGRRTDSADDNRVGSRW